MTWLMWRQHRAQLLIATALTAAFALPVLITGAHLHSAFDACRTSGGCGGNLLAGYNNVNTLINLSILVPAMIGLFWGATLIGRELESGTVALVWTQSLTRRRWLGTKLLTLFVGTALAGAVVSGLVTWWSSTRNATLESRFGGLQFDIQGVAPVGYCIFAAALGLAAGVVWRRTLPAMATTLGGFIGVRLLVELFARPHYMSPVTVITGMSKDRPLPIGSLNIGSDILRHGRVIDGSVIRVPDACASTNTRSTMDACMQHAGYQLRLRYQPADRYWTFQWIEFGIFVGLAAVLTAVAIVLLRRRDA